MASKVWSYRLYFQQETGDELVRRGDIVQVGEVFARAFGRLRPWLFLDEKPRDNQRRHAARAESIERDSEGDVSALRKAGEYSPSPQSAACLGKIGDLSEGPFVLPFVPLDGELKNFIAIPKDLDSVRIPTPAGWTDIHPETKESPSDEIRLLGRARSGFARFPSRFLTPVVQHVLNTMGGNGVPDYPEHMKEF